MKHIKIPAELKKMNAIFLQNGFEAYLVGGAVRDMILGKTAADWDITTNATPQDVMHMFHKVIPTGIAHGTVTVLFMRKQIEVTTYRTEADYSDGRHPDSISYAATIEEDLSRRDFTMNAIAANLSDGSLCDPFDGRTDIKNECIRTVGNPLERFMEDGLRPIRALRFSAQLGFTIEEATYKSIFRDDVQKKIQSISIERFRDEFDKLLASPEPSQGLHAMEETGVMKLFLPELAAGRGATQQDARGFHEFDVLDHNIYACDGAPRDNLTVRLAALFHDIGKTYTRTVESKQLTENEGGGTIEIIHFHGHEQESARMAKEILFRLKYPNAVIDKVCHLISQHMFNYEPTWSDAAVRRFIVRTGLEAMDDLFALRYADIYGMHRCHIQADSETVRNLNTLRERIRKTEQDKTALSLKDLAVNGNDLLALGIPAGKQIGLLLNELFQCVLDDPLMNTKEKLLTVAKNKAMR
ncbi:MAG: HD domain-containing protein [Treponema sp.]|nr:HD domain-containing protein [Treponema sp.]